MLLVGSSVVHRGVRDQARVTRVSPARLVGGGSGLGYAAAVALGVPGLLVGSWTHPTHPTGCTVVLPPPGTIGGCAVRGGAPGSRETPALGPTGSAQLCHAVLLTGGSAFGLAAADGVMAWCEEQGRGLELPTVTVPIVGAAVVFDVRVPGQPRPGADAGRAACEAAVDLDPAQGTVGVGAGCSVGKTAGRDHAVKGGQGWSVHTEGDLTVAALMAVNPVGDVIDEAGAVLAGDTAPPDAPRFPVTSMEALGGWGTRTLAAGGAGPGPVDGPTSNTVIGCVVTNGTLSKGSLCRVADLAHTGVARSVRPAHTSVDGDLLFALGTGAVPATVDLVAELAAAAVADAVRNAVRHATAIDGLPVDPRARRA